MKKILTLILLLISIQLSAQKSDRKVDNTLRPDTVVASKVRAIVSISSPTGVFSDTVVCDSIKVGDIWVSSTSLFPYIKTLTNDISWQSDVRGARSIGFGDYGELNNFYANGYGDYKPYIYFNSTSGISALGNDSTSLGIGPTNLFTDSRKYPIGIGYAGNYHKYLQSYSWVDKSYVDSIGSIGSTLTDNILKANNTTHTFEVYPDSTGTGSVNGIYLGTQNPIKTRRINLNGHLYPTKLTLNVGSSTSGTQYINCATGTAISIDDNTNGAIGIDINSSNNSTGIKFTGTPTGKLIYAITGIAKENLSINPMVADGATAIGYLYGLQNNLTTAGALHSAWQNSSGGNLMTLGNSGVLTVDSLINRLEKSAIADNGTITLATGVAGWGEAMIGDNQEWASFRFSADGTVTLISNTANAVNTDTDEKFCIYDGGSGVIIKNALGSTLKVAINVHYYIP